MDKDRKIFGVDISKDVFDVVDHKGNHDRFSNDAGGFSKFKKTLHAKALIVMEATGYSISKIERMINNGKLPSYKFNKLRRIKKG